MSSLRTKLGIGAIGALLVAGSATGVFSPGSAASAHDQDVYCQAGNVVYVNLTNYPADSTATIKFDGLVVRSGTFGGSAAPSLGFVRQVDPTVDHTVAVSVVGSDGVGTRDFSVQTAALCGYTPLPKPTPTHTPTPTPTTPPVVVTPTPTPTVPTPKPTPTTPPVVKPTPKPTPTTPAPKPTPTTPVVTPKPTPTHTPGGTPSPTPTRTPAHSTAPTPKPAVTHPAAASPKPSPSGSATVPAAAPRTTSTPSAVAVGTGRNTPRTGELAFTGAEGVIGGSIAATALLALGTMLIVAHRRAARRVRG